MIKIPIITQNFSSTDVFNDTPLMLLPQTPVPPLPDKDQEGFNQLLLHDLHRHRQSYVRSYTAFETLRKRQDFVLRQENLRSLKNFEQRVTTKQDQYIDQSLHSYEQCFVKIINGNIQEKQQRPKTSAPSFDKYHVHQLSHIPATPLDPPPIIPFHRYQQSHRPPLSSKYRINTNIHRLSQSAQDAFQSSSYAFHNQPFVSFTESYFQKYNDRSLNKLHLTTNNDEIKEKEKEEQRQIQSVSTEFHVTINQTKKQEQKPKISDLQQIRATASSRNTNTPLSTPQLGYNDAARDVLTIAKDNEDHRNKMSVINEKRRSSQQSTGQTSNSDSRKSTKRPKTATKKQTVVIKLTSDQKTESLPTKTIENVYNNDILKSAMIVQNYGNNAPDQNLPTKIERLPLPINTTNLQIKKTSVPPRTSIKSNDGDTEIKPFLDNIDRSMTNIERIEPIKEHPIIDNNEEQILAPVTNTITENKEHVNDQLVQQQQPVLEVIDNRKRIKKGAFDANDSMNIELGMLRSYRGAMKRNRFRLGKENKTKNSEDGTEQIPENEETLALLEKIRQSATGVSIGRMPVSQQSCRFELPHDLKLLENLTPLDYLSKYCRLSTRRNYQFKRIFDKYRNNQYRFESNNLYTSIIDIYTDTFKRSQYDYLCQLIDIGNEQYQFTFETFAGILALCERILYDLTKYSAGLDEHDLAKDTIEQCDFDSLQRKFDGLIISETMKKLLKTL